MTAHIMDITGLVGYRKLRQRVSLQKLLKSISLFSDMEAPEGGVTRTREDYEFIKRKHAALHKKLWEEQQRRK